VRVRPIRISKPTALLLVMSFLLAFALNVTHTHKKTLVLLHRYVLCILYCEEKCGFTKYLV